MSGEENGVMMLKNGVTETSLTVDKLDMISLNKRRIVLRYVGCVWDDVLYEAMQAVLDETDPATFDPEADFGSMIADISLFIGFNIQTDWIGTYADISVQMLNGITVNRRCVLHTHAEEIENVLNRFFDDGCPGVLPSFANHFKNFYLTWKSSSKKVFSL